MSKAADKAYEKIGKLILKGYYRPGDRLSEEELSRLSGVSRTPVRDALRRLETECFVVIRPNQGAEVAIWHRRDIKDLFEMRAMLEGMAASRAAERRTNENIEILEACVEKISESIAKRNNPDVGLFLEQNRSFHRALIDAACSPRLSAVISNLIAPTVIARTAETFSKADLKRSNEHHRDLLEAIRSQDSKLAEAIMHTHIHLAAKRYLVEND